MYRAEIPQHPRDMPSNVGRHRILEFPQSDTLDRHTTPQSLLHHENYRAQRGTNWYLDGNHPKYHPSLEDSHKLNWLLAQGVPKGFLYGAALHQPQTTTLGV